MLQPGSYSGKAADMWSLGIILYTLLVGHYPFFDTNPQTLFSKIRSGYYDIPDHISYLARSLISSLLAFEPHRRASPDAVLRHPWFSRTPDESFITPPPSVLDKDQTVPLKIYWLYLSSFSPYQVSLPLSPLLLLYIQVWHLFSTFFFNGCTYCSVVPFREVFGMWTYSGIYFGPALRGAWCGFFV